MSSPLDNILKKNSDNSQLDFQAGCLILVNKPLKWTSFDVVNKIRFKLKYGFNYKKIKVGHAGTLDPLADGLLIVCTGKYTKSIDSLQGQDKSYSGTIKIGATTPTYDAEAEEDERFPIEHVTDVLIGEKALGFVGKIDQVPPIYSAIKVKGQTAYTLARRGEEIKMKPRPVQIHKFDCIRESENKISFQVDCSKGTYIRSLAYDLGEALESGAYLTSLRRTGIGNYSLDDALDLDQVIEIINSLAGVDQ